MLSGSLCASPRKPIRGSPQLKTWGWLCSKEMTVDLSPRDQVLLPGGKGSIYGCPIVHLECVRYGSTHLSKCRCMSPVPREQAGLHSCSIQQCSYRVSWPGAEGPGPILIGPLPCRRFTAGLWLLHTGGPVLQVRPRLSLIVDPAGLRQLPLWEVASSQQDHDIHRPRVPVCKT